MNEQNELKTRYSFIDMPQNILTRQVPDKLFDMPGADNLSLVKLVGFFAKREISVQEMLTVLGLHDREIFLSLQQSKRTSEGDFILISPSIHGKRISSPLRN